MGWWEDNFSGASENQVKSSTWNNVNTNNPGGSPNSSVFNTPTTGSMTGKVGGTGLTGYASTYANTVNSGKYTPPTLYQGNIQNYSPVWAEKYNWYVGQGKGQDEAMKLATDYERSLYPSETIANNTIANDTKKDTDTSGLLGQIQSMMGQYSAPYESLLKDMLAAPSVFTMPSDSSIMSQATYVSRNCKPTHYYRPYSLNWQRKKLVTRIHSQI